MPGSLSNKVKREIAQDNALADRLTRLSVFEPKGSQELAFLSKKHIVWMLAGNKWGKSYCGITATGYNTVPEKDKDGRNTGWLLNPYIRKRIPARGINAWLSSWSDRVFLETLTPIFDLILQPYVTERYAERGIIQWAKTEAATIHVKSQNADPQTYEGANIDWIYADEPHKQAIYNAMTSRFASTHGYLWCGATLVVDPNDPDALLKMRILDWMIEIAAEWEADHDVHPEMDIIYGNIEENPFIDAAFQKRMWSGLNEQEFIVRTTGRAVTMIGRSAFSGDMLMTIDKYLQQSDESIPEYGTLGFEDDTSDIEIYPSPIQDFPNKPQNEYIFKIWQRPLAFDSLMVRPPYFIGVDVSAGKAGGDYTCAYVMRGDTQELVACLYGHLSEIELARQLYLLGMYYRTPDYEPAILAIETNTGSTTMSYMITGNAELSIPRYGRGRMYHRPRSLDMDKGLLIIGNEPGWLTTPKTRQHIITAVRQLLLESYEGIKSEEPHTLIYDRILLFECGWFILDKHGKYGAAPGRSSDDTIIAAGIAKKCQEQYWHKRYTKDVDEETIDETYFIKDKKLFFNPEALLRKERKQAKPKTLIY